MSLSKSLSLVYSGCKKQRAKASCGNKLNKIATSATRLFVQTLSSKYIHIVYTLLLAAYTNKRRMNTLLSCATHGLCCAHTVMLKMLRNY